MSSIIDLLTGSLDSRAVDSLGAQIGASPQQTGNAVQAALPLLLGALQRNAAGAGGAASLASALDRDHDGSVLDDVASFFGKAATGSDARSLDHIFGGRKPAIESALGRSSGLQAGQVTQLLAQLAPLVLGALARARSKGSGGAAAGGGLGDLLGGAMGHLQSEKPGLGGALGSLLDADGDGSALEDLFGGSSGGLGGMLGGLLGGGR